MRHQHSRTMPDRLRGLIPHLNSITDEQLTYLEADLLEESKLSLNYLMLILGSAGIATTGLIANSAAVIIGAMIIAPLMLPIRGAILGTFTGNQVLIRRAAESIIVGTLLGVGVSYVLSLVVPIASFGNEILSRTHPNTLDLVVALLAGAIGAFAKVRPRLADSLAGVAIAVALMPPLCVVGIGLAEQDWFTSGGAMMLYVTNLVGIALACGIVFFIVGYSSHRHSRWLSKGAIGTLCLLLFLVVVMSGPLSLSRIAVLQQDYFRVTVTEILEEDEETFQGATLLKSELEWRSDPPSAEVLVLSEQSFTPQQVQILENSVVEQTGIAVELTVKVVPVI